MEGRLDVIALFLFDEKETLNISTRTANNSVIEQAQGVLKITMKSIQEIFQKEFVDASSAVVQKMRRSEHNMAALQRNYTEHWPTLTEPHDLVVVAIEEVEGNKKRREIWCGFFDDTQCTGMRKEGLAYRLLVDRFQLVGIHDLDNVPDSEFYGNGGGGGSRVKVYKAGHKKGLTASECTATAAQEGIMVQRLIWVRKNHRKFRDLVHLHWGSKCAVADHDCDGHPGLLIASHIYPWVRSSPKEKTDVDNGLLLSSPLDRLFDQGLISFASDGLMLISPNLAPRTKHVFGLVDDMKIADPRKITKGMQIYLAKHRKFYGF